MPFLDEVDEIKAKTPVGGVPKPLIAGIVAVAVLVACLAGLQAVSSARGGFVVETGASSSLAANSSGETEGEGSSEGASDASVAAQESFYVYVVGAVNEPGVYELAAGARVNDAVQAAGGLAEGADAAAVNLARPVVDGEQVSIPVVGELQPAEVAGGGEVAQDAGGGPQFGELAPASGGITAEGKVNINIATSEELQTLKGIGEATAEKILASRDAEGPFQSPEDLKRVSGIGDKKFAAIADSIVV